MNSPTLLRHRRAYRVVFLCAAVYNVTWGMWIGVNPQWLFEFAGMPPMTHPVVFSCLGMVIGLYGLIYAEVARAPERGFVLAAVGLVGKVLGPAGWLWLYLTGAWPGKSVVMIVFNDLIWWAPFALYLIHAWPFFFQDLANASTPIAKIGQADSDVAANRPSSN